MVKRQKISGTASSLPGGLTIGLLTSLCITLFGSALGGWMILTEKISEEDIGYLSLSILLAASVLGAVVSWKKIKHRKLMVCVCSGGIYLLLLICITALFFGGQYQGFWVTALAVLGSSLCVGITGIKGNTGAHRRKYKMK